ncbi:hypothetical protein IWQ56_007419, partial [Coemansia nantahalensis]
WRSVAGDEPERDGAGCCCRRTDAVPRARGVGPGRRAVQVGGEARGVGHVFAVGGGRAQLSRRRRQQHRRVGGGEPDGRDPGRDGRDN